MRRVRYGVRRGLVLALIGLCAPIASPEARAQETRPSLEDVLTLWEIGERSAALSLSPDGTQVAFVEHRRRLDSDDYEHRVVVVPLDGRGAPRIVADAGDIILSSEDGRRSGSTAIRRALWSPDGGSLAYLNRTGGQTQLWRVGAGGRSAHAVARGPGDVSRFAWTPNGDLVFETLTPRAELAAAQHTQRRIGFRVDERLEARYGLFPTPREMEGRQTWIAGRRMRLATSAEAALLTRRGSSALRGASSESFAVANARGDAAWFSPLDANTRAYRPVLAVYTRPVGAVSPTRCEHPLCRGAVTDVWMTEMGDVVFQKTEGFARSERGLYRWWPEIGEVTLIRREEEVVLGCELTTSRLLCIHETTLQPRRIVAIDLADGALTPIYDPNPHWRDFIMPRVERLDVHDYRGVGSFGRLFYPADYRPGVRYPLVFVQYRARGFLRGGVGGEYPVHGFVQRGYFVVVTEKPDHEELWSQLDLAAATRITELEHVEQRSKQSALDALLELLRARGDVDMDRIAITGLSDGAETVYWALTHSNAFAVALTSTPPTDPIGWPLGSEAFRIASASSYGFGGDWERTAPEWRQFWRTMSPQFHVERIRAPILMQLSESEAVQAFPFYARMREENRAIEFYIYPGAYHLKTRPQHLLAAQRRALDWVDFWMRGVVHPDPNDPDRAERWLALRENQESRAGNLHPLASH